MNKPSCTFKTSFHSRISKVVMACGLVTFVGCAPVAKQLETAKVVDQIQAAEVSLSVLDKSLIDWVENRKQGLLDELRHHVEINTGTLNVDGLNQYRDLLGLELEKLGFSTQIHPAASMDVLSCEGQKLVFADHLVATKRPANGEEKRRILVNGHLDTVFAKDDEFQKLVVEADGTLKGPGVADMKGGIVVMLNALRAVHQAGLLDDAHVTVLLNTDEEFGSLSSRSLIEELAKQHDVGLVYEGTHADLVTRARKGLGQLRLKVTGRESHAGAAHEQGVSANLELARKVIEIEKLTDYDKQVTVNVGQMAGGEKRNTVPGCADAYVDLRFPTQNLGEALKQDLLELTSAASIGSETFPEYPKVESWAVLHRPVKARNDEVDQLISQAMGYSALIGQPIKGSRFSGGGTDGSIAQGVGLPTIDSIGVDGAGAHSSREESHFDSLVARTKLAAVMLAKQIQLGQ